ncbi:cysteine desulfurase family protein [Alkalilimnicola ehrlichii MLHE-1]|uniref:cysteine desulfurase n=1 Tax=Alkalilimnicola ehrlichii (strain ATCC BAA-1101 / DSM 17681 / MLHE-1) TaxID=187272 RepID=Q0AB09_ALKEH|nr:cysteine desulfurase family protein [Alkalilimnicola ehrlichii]ABI55978.1 aminotransferase, class V [Alkalilimnicola ehrlichii MLHE-1]
MSAPTPIYLDYNASTPIAPEVAKAMAPYLQEAYGNPSAGHWAGGPAREAVEQARRQVARLIGAAPDEIVFTSGGSEANNHAIKGTWYATEGPFHIITTAVEHPATLVPCRFLESLGASLTVLPVDRYGQVNPDAVQAAITPETRLISVMHANNEVGTLQPVEAIGRIARDHGVRFHVDAAQSAGKVPINVQAMGVDLLSLAGHKFYGPKGIGALYVRRGIDLTPLIHGAGHEGGRRAGTESALLATGLGTAAEKARDLSPMARVQALRDRLWTGLKGHFGDTLCLNGHPQARLPNTLNVAFADCVGAAILDRLDGVAASTGSACHAGSVTLSPVLAAMGVPERVGMGALRFSLGRWTTEQEIDEVIARLARAVPQARAATTQEPS